MELKYCDRCGNPMKLDSSSQGSGDEIVCLDCQDQDADKACSSSGSKLHLVDSPPPRAPRDEFDDGLDLFSHNTVVMKKNAMSERKKPTKKSLPPLPAPEDSPALPPPDESLELFSPQTLLLKKQKRKVREDNALIALEPENGSVYLSDPNGMGSAAPARTATRIQLQCVHCQKKLVIRPVYRASKMICPGCSKKMYISASNRVSKSAQKHPDNDSSTVTGDTMIAKIDVPGEAKHDTPASSLSGEAALSSLIKQSSERDSQVSEPSTAPTAQATAPQATKPEAASLDFSPPVDSEIADLVFQSKPAENVDLPLDLNEPLVGGELAVGLEMEAPPEGAPSSSLNTTADVPTQRPENAAPTSAAPGGSTLTFRTCILAVCVGVLLSLPFFTAAYLTNLEHSRQENAGADSFSEEVSENLRSLGVAVRDGFKRLLGQQ